MMLKLLCLYVFLHVITAFPENLKTITKLQNVPQRFIIGDDVTNPLYAQHLKTLSLGGPRRVAIASREKLYFLQPGVLSPFLENDVINATEILTWKSTRETRELCQMKGQPQELCYNYLSIVETKSADRLVICGTNSYSPQCASYKISDRNNRLTLTQDGAPTPGRQISPYGPDQSSASHFSDGFLYSATYQSFLGGAPVISKTMGNTPSLRTDTDTPLMKEPKFVKITEDSDRVLIFFNEEDPLPTGETRNIAQVAQICKNDEGGDRILPGMFTTFIKSRLNCSYNGFYLDEVRDVTDPIQVGGQSIIFATFATPDNSLSGSAICAFNLSSIRSAMNGPFLITDETSVTSGSAAPTGNRHPGLCSEEKSTDADLVFVKSHPQMEKHAVGSLLLTNQGQRWTAITVDVLTNPKNLTVLFIGTDDGHLLRALPPSSGNPQGKIISDQEVFNENRCSKTKDHGLREERIVKRVLIEGDTVLVGFKHCVVSVPLRWCSVHECRTSCLRSSDPYCGWNGTDCVPFFHSRQQLERNLNSASDISMDNPCNNKIENSDPQKTEAEKLTPTHSNDIEENVSDKHEEGSYLEKQSGYPLYTIIIVAVLASVGTLVLLALVYCCCVQCCMKSRGRKDTDEIHKMTPNVMAKQPGGAQSSFSKRVHKTFCGIKSCFIKTATPMPSPDTTLKRDLTKSHQRHQNNYSEAPLIKQTDVENARKSRKLSSRLHSTSSSTSREDCLRISNQRSNLLDANAELTLPKHFSEQATLPLPPKSPEDSSTSSGVSSQYSGSSPVFPENGNGAAETGILPTASAKLRRRNEYATRKTSEIMKEPDAAMGQFGNFINNYEAMQSHGRVISPSRLRIDSHDSGQGDSCRNSLRTEVEQNFPMTGAHLQRPASLNIHKSQPGRRKRLLSEGSYPSDSLQFSHEVAYHFTRERRASGNHSNSSHSPVSDLQNVFIPQQKEKVFADCSTASASPYSTLSKDDSVSKPQPRDLLRLKESFQQAMIVRQPIDTYLAKADASQHAVAYHNELVFIPSMMPCSVPSQPVNYYPSLQVRGAHAQKPMTYNPQQPQQKRRSYSPPQNFYPSLPMHNKTVSPSRNSHPQYYNSLERQSMPSKQRQSVPLARHTSMPASQRPVGLVSPLNARVNNVVA